MTNPQPSFFSFKSIIENPKMKVSIFVFTILEAHLSHAWDKEKTSTDGALIEFMTLDKDFTRVCDADRSTTELNSDLKQYIYM